MKPSLKLSLKSGEKIYINGAIIRVDRKVSLELLNEATFLLQHHVLKVEDANTPLKQLYFIIQASLINPQAGRGTKEMGFASLSLLQTSFADCRIQEGLAQVEVCLRKERPFDALKIIRAMFALETQPHSPAVAQPPVVGTRVRSEVRRELAQVAECV
jgi:flagellar protein FlbT